MFYNVEKWQSIPKVSRYAAFAFICDKLLFNYNEPECGTVIFFSNQIS